MTAARPVDLSGMPPHVVSDLSLVSLENESETGVIPLFQNERVHVLNLCLRGFTYILSS